MPRDATYVHVACRRFARVATYADREQPTCTWVADTGRSWCRASAPCGRIRNQRGNLLWHLAGDHMGQSDALQDCPLRGPQRDPDLLQWRGRPNVGKILRATATYVGQLAVERPDHVRNADLRRRPGQSIAALWTALAPQQARTTQLTQNAFQVFVGIVLRFGE